MSIEKLLKLVPPPAKPYEVGDPKKWSSFEKKLGTKLPSDYREFVMHYGTGLFAGLYMIYNPYSKSKYLSLLECVDTQPDDALEPDDYEFYPEEGGLLPWGKDENGNYYYWKADGEPDEWTVVQCNERGDGYAAHNLGMSAFLLGILEGRVTPLASDYPNENSFRFEPFKGT